MVFFVLKHETEVMAQGLNPVDALICEKPWSRGLKNWQKVVELMFTITRNVPLNYPVERF
jgi:hypothetical protein